MKKLNYLWITLLLVFYGSCKKQNEAIESKTITSTNSNAKIDDEAIYDAMLRTAAIGLLYYQNDVAFRATVNAGVAKQFDGDDNVLMRELGAAYANMPTNFQTSINLHGTGLNCYTDLPHIGEAINGFEYFDDSAYIQIYIPNADIVDLNSTPIICINTDDDEVLPGYYIDASGVLQVIDEVDEEYAETHLVWVVSVNETTGIKFGGEEINFGSYFPAPPTADDMLFRNDYIYFWDKKENWGNGRGEFSYQVTKYLSCSDDPNHHVEFTGINAFRICKNDLNKNFVWEKYFANYEPGFNDVWRGNEFLGIIFYELDKKRTFDIKINFDSPCYGYIITSKQDPYNTARLERTFGSSSSWVTFVLPTQLLGPENRPSNGADFHASSKNY